MKKLFLVLVLVLVCGAVQAQCTSKIVDVIVNDSYGQTVVKTEYKVNGKVVNIFGEVCALKDDKYFDSRNIECILGSRYNETNGTYEQVIALAKENIKEQREAFIQKIPNNRAFIGSETLKRDKELSEVLKDEIKSGLIGWEGSTSEVEINYKNKKIKVTHDEENIVTDSIAVP